MSLAMTKPNWIPISEVHQDWREQFIILAASGRIKTKVGLLTTYDLTTASLSELHKRWAYQVREMTGSSRPSTIGAALWGAPVLKLGDTKAAMFRKAVSSLIDSGADLSDELFNKCAYLYQNVCTKRGFRPLWPVIARSSLGSGTRT